VTQESLAAPSATLVATSQTLTSGLRRVIWRHMPAIGFSQGLPGAPTHPMSALQRTPSFTCCQPANGGCQIKDLGRLFTVRTPVSPSRFGAKMASNSQDDVFRPKDRTAM
jgi:hypothetical protein